MQAIDTVSINQSTDLRELSARATTLDGGGEGSKSKFGPCPKCGGDDRFVVYREKFLCRKCHPAYGDAIEYAAWLNEYDLKTRTGLSEAAEWLTGGAVLEISPEKLAEWRKAETERKAAEVATTLGKIERLNASNNAARYHQQLTPAARQWWYAKGLNDASISRWQLGHTTNCPTAKGRESYTIPISYAGQLYNIRHRLANADNGDKYRPEMAGLPAAMFNADVLADDSGFVSEVVLVEGEIKAMVLQQHGFDAVGIPGANTFKSKWLNLFPTDKRVYVALDPGADDHAENIWRWLGAAGVPVKLCHFPVKPDDFFVVYGGSVIEFYVYLMLGMTYSE